MISRMGLNESTLSWTEESFYSNESSPKDPSGRQLEEISQSFRPFTDAIRGIKERIESDLKHLKIDERDFRDFNLDTMNVLLSLRKDTSVEEFLKTSYVGCFDVMLCLKTVAIGTPLDKEVSSMAKRLIGRIQNALSVIGNVLKEQHWSIPDLRSERTSFNETVLEHLMELTDVYLKTKQDYPRLRRYENLIKNFGLVQEIDRALEWLLDEFEELRHNLHGIHREHEFSLQDENMERLITFADEE